MQLVKELFDESLESHEAGGITWYLRNQFFFELGLEGRDDVLLVRYEDLVQDPARHAARVFAFLGHPFDPAWVDDVSSASISKRPFAPVREEVRKICDDMLERLDAAYGRQLAAEGPNP